MEAGLALYDTIKHVKSEIVTVNIGQCTSTATLILGGGTPKRRYGLKHSRVLLLQPSGLAEGTAEHIKIQAQHLLKIKSNIIKIYSEITGQSTDRIARDIDRDNFMSAQECLEYGLIDHDAKTRATLEDIINVRQKQIHVLDPTPRRWLRNNNNLQLPQRRKGVCWSGVSELQESLDNYCPGELSFARVLVSDVIGCFKYNELDFTKEGSCFDDCRNIIKCPGEVLGFPKKYIDVNKIDWDNLTNGCPCNENNFKLYLGCQNVTKNNKPCINWNGGLTTSSPLYKRRYQFPKNYCRKIFPNDKLKCLTRINVLEDCEPKDVKILEMQPGTLFDLWVSPYIPKFKMSITFITTAHSCGDLNNEPVPFIVRTHAYKPYDVITGGVSQIYSDQGAFYESFKNDKSLSMMFKGFDILQNVKTSVYICGCFYNHKYESFKTHVPCSNSSHFTLELAKIKIDGTNIPRKRVKSNVHQGIRFKNDLWNLSGVLSIINESDVSALDLKETDISRVYMTSVETLMEIEIKQRTMTQFISNVHRHKKRYRNIHPIRKLVTTMDFIEFKVPLAGDYVAIFQNTSDKTTIVPTAPSIIVQRYSIVGYDSQKMFSLIADVNKYREQSIFFKSWKIFTPPIAVVIAKDVDSGRCQEPIAYSINIFPIITSDIDKHETGWRASDFNTSEALQLFDKSNKFEVCILTGKGDMESLGYGIIRDNVNHTLDEVFPSAISIPSNLSSYIIDSKWDMLNIHIKLNEDNLHKFIINGEIVSRDPFTNYQLLEKKIFATTKSSFQIHGRKGKGVINDEYLYPAVLSFWCYTNSNLVRVWMMKPSRLSPTYITFINVPSPLAFEIVVTANEVLAIVLSEGALRLKTYKVTMIHSDDKNKDPLTFKLDLMLDSCDHNNLECPTFVSPRDMKIIHYMQDCLQQFLVIVSDGGTNCIYLLNTFLQLVSKICSALDPGWSGIQEPGYISCTRSEEAAGNCISNDGSKDNPEKRYANCFITQRHAGSILWVRVDLRLQIMELMQVYKGAFLQEKSLNQDSPQILQQPISVIAVSYESTDLIYVVQAETSTIMLLMLEPTILKEKRLIHYGYTEIKAIPYGNYAYITSLIMSRVRHGTLNHQDYLLLFRFNEGHNSFASELSGSINIINLQDTISVNDFHYVMLDWIVVGKEYKLVPKVDTESGNFSFSINFELEIVTGVSKTRDIGCIDKTLGANKAPLENIAGDWNGNETFKNEIEISPHGEIRLLINYAPSSKLVVRVVAVGFIESKCITLEFNIACKDGYYYTGISADDLTTGKLTNGCTSCPIGRYNSLYLVKRDIKNFSTCTKCPEFETTITTGATSASQCVCAPGYTLTDLHGHRCQPCPAGTWKSDAGMQDCIGNSCYRNSTSTITGSVTEEGRQCECNPGYYYKLSLGQIKECVACEQGYFCEGGFEAPKKKCPTNTTSIEGALEFSEHISYYTPGAASINNCICKPGYELADATLINTKNAAPFKLMKRISIEIEDMQIDVKDVNMQNLVCIPCGEGKYKSMPGNTSCQKCPPHTFTKVSDATNVNQCNHCDPGYFETGDIQAPCEPCSEGSICVGSDPIDADSRQHRGKRIKCPENSQTIRPYTSNTHMSYCLCEPGYENVLHSGFVKCIPVANGYFKDTIGNGPGIKCPYGSMTKAPGATSHDECACDPGRFFDSETKYCRSCPLGKYCPGGRDSNLQHLQPLTCPDLNEATNKKGASSIADCYCKAGYFKSITGQDGCVPCPENHYKDSTSPDKCSPCDDNSSTNGMQGATSKEQCVCEPGYYFDKSCVPCSHTNMYCPGGTLKDNTLRALYTTHPPVSCPANTEIPPGMDAASSYDDCKCAKGYGFILKDPNTKTKICEPCPPGTYKSSVMDSSCNGLCTQNATSVPGAKSPAQCFCQVGYFYLAGGICTSCLEGAECKGGLVSDAGKGLHQDLQDHVKPVAISGYYLDKIQTELKKTDDWKFIKCPIPGACLGKDKCSQSMTGYLCSECKKGYTNNFVKGAICRPCPKTMVNVSLNILWYLGLLLVNIVMACLNVSAGFNRRSVHSVVIKIALNYGICMSVLNAINFSELSLPSNIKSMTMSWAKVLYHDNKIHYTSIDCLLQRWFNMKHADSFFYTMLFIACLPAILLVVVTLLMWIILELFKIKRYKTTRSKLILLQQSQAQGMQYLSERLYDEYSNERLFLIFRYIPLPGETSWVRFKHFMEDMIPIYVTVLFSLHDNTTSQMLSLLDCTCINLGRSLPSKYILRPAMSIKCSLDPKMGYIPYLILGLSGLIIWGFGIPFFSFFVLLINRKNLYAPDIRMKYGFLHNGYQQHYWFWETIVFIRKCLVLVIGSIVIVPSQNGSGSRIWMALVVAVIFLIAQLIYKPFDERDYFVLGRLESHSMIAWTLSLILACIVIDANFDASDNIWVIYMGILINVIFIFIVVKELAIAYCNNVRVHKRYQKRRFFGWFFRLLAQFATNRKLREPLILFNTQSYSLQLRSPKQKEGRRRSRNIFRYEKEYFSHIVGEIMSFPINQMKLDIIPIDFTEFITRLIFAVHCHESNEQKANSIVKCLADGDLNQLVNLTLLQKRVTRVRQITSSSQIVTEDNDFERIPPIVKPELMFDEEVVSAGVPLSDFYMALSIIKLRDAREIATSYGYFVHYQSRIKADELSSTNTRLEEISGMISRVKQRGITPDDHKILFCTSQDLEDLEDEIARLDAIIQDFKRDPLGALEKHGYNETIQKANEEQELDFENELQRFGFRIRPHHSRGA
ncbi:bifunctional ClpP-crotonase-like domain superfamily/EGF-like domain/Growth factor receptor cysteine-rich domain superfamily/Kringle-like fold/ATP-dependent Clp protease proteolytic subunit/Clp protease proteolytic subunit -Translocation-enhancing protein TepA/Tyrosine-protein kinase ephrin type A-B receptor-like [Babesia duncani]|uniref:EGF-like domain-containing protein n=1 Tax=Babesia duncani TaxID=323732 RepID=A0AAD9PPB5_9APIC|nr:bifunctional ClpP-crotonase-like domain superfamily/EGF-like domain/Growth factor receptor cysteine-rich domain superfamily/Kringle-like fold/ATP-dependent Clp protease proteolytic subunit/Clp protease proteolytic subunit -Translocation-enhancing protein TepA/Tyrosine-protein kinase ephrin type A-B receptor-like [Babesia duncani]